MENLYPLPANQFGVPFTACQTDEETLHLKAVMANVQAYIDNKDTEEATRQELTLALGTLQMAFTRLVRAMSPAPRV